MHNASADVHAAHEGDGESSAEKADDGEQRILVGKLNLVVRHGEDGDIAEIRVGHGGAGRGAGAATMCQLET